MSSTRDDSVTAEFAETVNAQRLRSSQAFRSEQYRQACLTDPEAVKAYEAEIERRRAARADRAARANR